MNPAQHEIDPRQLLQQMLLIRAYEEAIVADARAAACEQRIEDSQKR